MSMRQRARRLRGELEMGSNNGKGATIKLRVGLSRGAEKERAKAPLDRRR
jgi:nitrate/nitrite-specific signal transduction histidine kinase